MERLRAGLVSAVVLAAVLYPLSWPRVRDSFPLSNYPMFARGRTSAALTMVYAIALDGEGARVHVPPALVANREVLQARAVLARAAASGKRGTTALCGRIAGRVAESRGGVLGRAREVHIVRGSHDAVAYFQRGELGRERVLARCPVPGRAEGR